MKTTFQAKEIQEMLGIPKHRYEYLAVKIGITPDIESGEGRGTMHIYSFRNALQFALAHRLNAMGCVPSIVRLALSVLDRAAREGAAHLYDPARPVRGQIVFFNEPDRSGLNLTGELDPSRWPSTQKAEVEHARALEKTHGELEKAIRKGDEEREQHLREWLGSQERMDQEPKADDVEAYQVLDVGVVKKKVQEYALKE